MIRVPLTEVARSFAVRQMSGYHRGLFPFALQRLMQSRRLVVQIPNRPELKMRVVLWSFRWDNTPWIAIWYKLGLGKKEENVGPASCDHEHCSYFPKCPVDCPRVPVCEKCLPELRLFRADLFSRAASLLEKITSSNTIPGVARSWYASPAQLLNSGGKPFSFLFERPFSRKPSLLVWYSPIKDPLKTTSHHHTYEILAILEMESKRAKFPVPLAKEDLASLSTLLRNEVEAIAAVLAGKNPEGKPAYKIWVERRIPRGQESHWAQTESPPGSSQHVSEVLSFINRSVQGFLLKARPRAEDFDTVSLASPCIARCSEPIQTSPDTFPKAGYASFLWSPLQMDLLNQKAKSLIEGPGMAIALEETLNAFRDVWNEKFKTARAEVLASIGVKPSNKSERGCKTSANEVQRKLVDALTQPFPVDTVISNRIMGSGCCEDVFRIYESLGGPVNVEGYPPAELVAERLLLPKELQHHLLYVPVPLPGIFTKRQTRDFFRCFAVLMVPPELVCSEGFRDVVEGASEALFIAFLLDTFGQMSSAAKAANRCRALLMDGRLHDAKEAMQQMADLRLKALLSTVRFFDPWLPYDQIWDRLEALRLPWNITWPAPSKTAANLVRLLTPLEELGEAAKIASVLPWHERNAILDASYRNVQHGGLKSEIANVITFLGRFLVPGLSPQQTDQAIQRLRSIQGRWELLAGRACEPWDGSETTQARAVQTDILEQAIAIVKDIRQSDGVGIKVLTNFKESDCLELCESRTAILEIIVVLLDNLIKHRETSPYHLDLAFVRPEESSFDLLKKAYSDWQEQFKCRLVAQIRVAPFNGDSLNVQNGCEGLLQLQGTKSHGIGTWCLGVITKAYCEGPSRKETQGPMWNAPASVEAVKGDAVYIWVPCRVKGEGGPK